MNILLIAYDNDSFIHWFPQGIGYIAAVCREKGHNVEIYNQDMYHWTESHLRTKLDKNKYDVIGLGACGGYYQYRKALKIAEAVNEAENKPFFILGGHLASPEPEYFLRRMKLDAVIIGEGEKTIIELLEAVENKTSLEKVNGIAFIENEVFKKTSPRELIKDIDTIPFPAYDLFPIEYYSLLRMPHIKNNELCMPILSGRGCTFQCNFCYRMDKGFRPRSSDSIIEEIKLLKTNYNIKYFAFSDELLMNSEERTIHLCSEFIKNNLDIKWDCNGRLNYAKPEVLKMMKKAGCVYINYGIESMDAQALINMNKALTPGIIIKGVENTIAEGITPGLNIIFGNIGEDLNSLKLGVDFLLKYDDHTELRTIRPVTPYPGSPLYYKALEDGLLNDVEDFYENKHLNSDLLAVNFTELSDQEVHSALYDANKQLIEKYFDIQRNNSIEEARKLYKEKNVNFRGFRQS